MLKKTAWFLLAVILIVSFTNGVGVAAASVPISAIEFGPTTSTKSINVAEIAGSFTVTEEITSMEVEATFPDPEDDYFQATSMTVKDVYATDPSGSTTRVWDTKHTTYDPRYGLRTLVWYFEDINIPTRSTVVMGIDRFCPIGVSSIEISITLNSIRVYTWSGLPSKWPEESGGETLEVWSILDDMAEQNFEPGQYYDTTDHWAEDYIEKSVTQRGVNYDADESANRFMPDGKMTRAIFVKSLALMSGEDIGPFAIDTDTWPFIDVVITDEAVQYISWTHRNGIVYGTSATTFNPEGSITREDMATILNRYFVYRNTELPVTMQDPTAFTDAANIQDYARDHVIALQKAGIVSGYPDSGYHPQDPVSRAETAKILWSLYESGVIGIE